MDDHGYTLVEALAALAVIGLALGAMTGVVTAIARLQQKGGAVTANMAEASTFTNALDGLLRDEGPFPSAGGRSLVGDHSGFRFDCPSGACGVAVQPAETGLKVVLTGEHGARTLPWPWADRPQFTYIGGRTSGDHWPPDNPTDWQPLRAIEVTRAPSDTPVAVVRLWIEGAGAASNAGALQ